MDAAAREAVERAVNELKIARAARPARTWVDWLPQEYRRRADGATWPTALFQEALTSDTRASVPEPPTPAALSAYVDAALARRRAERAALRKRDHADATSAAAAAGNGVSAAKRAKLDVPSRSAPGTDAPEAKEDLFSEAAVKAAFEAVWRLDFGAPFGNPFRARLTAETVAQLGMADYLEKVREPSDLSLVREKLKAGAYASDAAVRRDVKLIASNARRYHPSGHPVIDYADQLVRVFEAQYLDLTTTAGDPTRTAPPPPPPR
eukprot:CAMPEP_0185715566 /NCGR_PEP_ID=MMETSP1164-20130828/41048_1 /TAXON_ID=1104430 /ORGANISM="Chrysoreinhardia sp, Strain CCMP2950" /LENGTH=263 /DNA_ID=CAMNT_0028383163 /DNA_START=26 /DNA_END=817 /DNA_ORIENTATION=+